MTDNEIMDIAVKHCIKSDSFPALVPLKKEILSAMREAMRLEVIAFEEWRLKMNSFEFSDAELYFSKIRNTEEQYNYYLNHMK